MVTFLEFEKPVAELQARIKDLKDSAGETSVDIDADIAKLEAKVEKQLQAIYAKLTPWPKTQVARHTPRTHSKDLLAALVQDFTPLAGDPKYSEDHALVGGPARPPGRPRPGI